MKTTPHHRQRGQIFTADFVMAIAILVIGLGALLQSTEFSERSAATRVNTYSNLADTLADMVVTNTSYITPPNTCIRFYNGTNTTSAATSACATFNCTFAGGNTFESQRLANCNSTQSGLTGPCVVQVFTCQ